MTVSERDEIISCLEAANIEFEVYSHDRIYTSEEAADERDHSLEKTVKSLVLRVDDYHVLYALPGDRLVDFEAVAEALNASDVSLGDPEVVEEVTGCEVGSVPPFGPCLGLQSYVDESVFDNDVIHASLATHTDSVKVETSAFKKLDFSVLDASYHKN